MYSVAEESRLFQRAPVYSGGLNPVAVIIPEMQVLCVTVSIAITAEGWGLIDGFYRGTLANPVG